MDDITTEAYDYYRETDAGTVFELPEYTAWKEIYQQTRWFVSTRKSGSLSEQFNAASMVVGKIAAEQLLGRISRARINWLRWQQRRAGNKIRKKFGM